MKITKISGLKKGLPQTSGQEVKSVHFVLRLSQESLSSSYEVLQSVIKDWLLNELELQTADLVFERPIKLTLANRLDEQQGFLAIQPYQLDTIRAFEMQVVAKFYKGWETARVRVIHTGAETNIQISTFMESKDPSRALHDIPRIADSFALLLGNDSRIEVLVENDLISPRKMNVTPKNISKSPLALYNKPGKMPVIGFLQGNRSSEIADQIIQEVFGLAHVLLLSSDLYLSQKGNPPNGDKFFVYWRDGSKAAVWFDSATEIYRFKRQLFVRSLRDDYFASQWRSFTSRIQVTRSQASKAIAPVINEPRGISYDEQLLELQILLEDARAEAKTANGRWQSVQKELDDTIAQYDESDKNFRRKSAEAVVLAGQLHRKIKSGRITAHDFIIHVDLSEDSRVDASLQHLSAITDYAIVFTENASHSWRQAKKAGYTDYLVMEEVLENLARFALDYKFKKAEVGNNIPKYAKTEFGLVWANADQKLRQKSFVFDGKTWDQQRHVKAEAPKVEGMADLGRIHFDLDPIGFRVIVNLIAVKQYDNGK